MTPLLDARTKRSQHAKTDFKTQHPCPTTGSTKRPCNGYVIDHVKALVCGGADRPENIQRQTKGAAKAKDKVQRKGC